MNKVRARLPLVCPDSLEDFEAISNLLNLLGNLTVQSAKNVYGQFNDVYSYDFTPKDCCERLPDDCSCDEGRSYYDYDNYDDSFSDELDEKAKSKLDE